MQFRESASAEFDQLITLTALFEDGDEDENEAPVSSWESLSFQPNHSEGLETGLGLEEKP